MKGRVLIIAGSDSGGGAGIQADIKTVTALGGYAATAVTAITVQDTLGVHGVFPVPVDVVIAQAERVLNDIGADAIKVGMIGTAELAEALSPVLDFARDANVPVVLDPVMMAKGGSPLLAEEAIAAVKRDVVVHATVLTPNLPEAERLSGLDIRDVDDMRHAAESLRSIGADTVLVKGGHGEGAVVHDVLADGEGIHVFESPRLHTRHTHGTGCTLSSAIATGLAQGLTVPKAVERARRYLHRAIMTAPGFGRGHGPVNHGHCIAPFD